MISGRLRDRARRLDLGDEAERRPVGPPRGELLLQRRDVVGGLRRRNSRSGRRGATMKSRSRAILLGERIEPEIGRRESSGPFPGLSLHAVELAVSMRTRNAAVRLADDRPPKLAVVDRDRDRRRSSRSRTSGGCRSPGTARRRSAAADLAAEQDESPTMQRGCDRGGVSTCPVRTFGPAMSMRIGSRRPVARSARADVGDHRRPLGRIVMGAVDAHDIRARFGEIARRPPGRRRPRCRASP